MGRWTVTYACSGRVRYSPDGGGKARFAQFEYTATPAPDSQGITVTRGDRADANLDRWYPSIKAGIEEGRQRRLNDGKLIVGIQIEITKVTAHSVDTTESAMKSAGVKLWYQIEEKLREVVE
jgi:hypothetical protein